jgi:Dolichyl-phosphate-mannose-protein mannosyltransferase
MRREQEPMIEPESKRRRRAYAALALLLCFGFWLATQCYWVSVTSGVDHNGYLLGGRLLADHQFHGITPPDPYAYLGPDWVTAGGNRFELKYPLGLPALYAMVHWLAGPRNGSAAAHQLSPAAATLALWGAFLLFRPIVGSFFALLGMILLASSPMTVFFSNMPNSHACALCVAVWGMYHLLQWQRGGNPWRGLLAGLLLGFNFTVRYAEGLLLLPLLAAIAFSLWADRRSIRQAALPLIAWLIPVAALLSYNLAVMGHLSGYSLTHESTAFSIHYFSRHWRLTLVQFYDHALGLLLPAALLGGLLLLIQHRRLAVVLWCWAAPTTLLYTAYYWPIKAARLNLGYARFFLTALPPLIVAALWLLRRIAQGGRVPTLLMAALVAVTSALNLRSAAAFAAGLQWNNLTCMVFQRHVLADVPAGSVIFAQQRNIPALRLARDYRGYWSNLFTQPFVQDQEAMALAGANDDPEVLQPERAAALYRLLGHESDAQLIAQQNRVMAQAIAQGHGVYVVLPAGACRAFRRRFLNPEHWRVRVIDQWRISGTWRADLPPARQPPSYTMQIMAVEPARPAGPRNEVAWAAARAAAHPSAGAGGRP